MLLKPNFYDELAEVFIWTRDYLKNALDDYDATTYQSGARGVFERADKTQAKNEADSAFDSESWDKARKKESRRRRNPVPRLTTFRRQLSRCAARRFTSMTRSSAA